MTLFQYLSLLFDNFREMGKAADAAAAQAASKKSELDVVLSDSQKMKVVPCSHIRTLQHFEAVTLQLHFVTHVCQEHCASYKLHIDQAVKVTYDARPCSSSGF